MLSGVSRSPTGRGCVPDGLIRASLGQMDWTPRTQSERPRTDSGLAVTTTTAVPVPTPPESAQLRSNLYEESGTKSPTVHPQRQGPPLPPPDRDPARRHVGSSLPEASNPAARSNVLISGRASLASRRVEKDAVRESGTESHTATAPPSTTKPVALSSAPAANVLRQLTHLSGPVSVKDFSDETACSLANESGIPGSKSTVPVRAIGLGSTETDPPSSSTLLERSDELWGEAERKADRKTSDGLASSKGIQLFRICTSLPRFAHGAGLVPLTRSKLARLGDYPTKRVQARSLPLKQDLHTEDTRPSRLIDTIDHSSSGFSKSTADIPSATVFASDAEPLHLPRLDEYLVGISKVSRSYHFVSTFPSAETSGSKVDFSEPDKVLGDKEREGWLLWPKRPVPKWGLWARLQTHELGDKDVEEARPSHPGSSSSNPSESIFPPFHLIPKSTGLADLKYNQATPPPFLSANSILGLAVDSFVIGFEGSDLGANLLRLETLRDLFQTLAPSLGFVAVSNPTVSGSRKFVLATLPNLLAFNLSDAFGWTLIWFGVFVVLCAAATYEFWRTTGGWKGVVDREGLEGGEGFDIQDKLLRERTLGGKRWRQSRRYKMTIVFLVTTLVS
jgi:hypothetical protein